MSLLTDANRSMNVLPTPAVPLAVVAPLGHATLAGAMESQQPEAADPLAEYDVNADPWWGEQPVNLPRL
jgi:hypothetical protein